MTVFLDITFFSPVDINRRFIAAGCLHLQSRQSRKQFPPKRRYIYTTLQGWFHAILIYKAACDPGVRGTPKKADYFIFRVKHICM